MNRSRAAPDAAADACSPRGVSAPPRPAPRPVLVRHAAAADPRPVDGRAAGRRDDVRLVFRQGLRGPRQESPEGSRPGLQRRVHADGQDGPPCGRRDARQGCPCPVRRRGPGRVPVRNHRDAAARETRNGPRPRPRPAATGSGARPACRWASRTTASSWPPTAASRRSWPAGRLPSALSIPPDAAQDMQKSDFVLYMPELPGNLTESAAQKGMSLPIQEVWMNAVKGELGVRAVRHGEHELRAEGKGARAGPSPRAGGLDALAERGGRRRAPEARHGHRGRDCR